MSNNRTSIQVMLLGIIVLILGGWVNNWIDNTILISMLFMYSVLVTCYGYLRQLYKIIIKQSSEGVSTEAFLIIIVGSISMSIFANENQVVFIGVTDIVFCFIILMFMNKYNKDIKIKYNHEFFLALICSFFMIYGIMQLTKTLKMIN